LTVLPDHHIERLVFQKSLIHPYLPKLLQPASYDVRLDPILRVPVQHSLKPIDLADPDTTQERTQTFDMDEHGGFALYSGRFVLGATMEVVDIPDDIVGRIEGKSTLARMGLQIHCAGYLDPGFKGNVTVELVNFFDTAIILRPGVKIAQFSFEYMTEPCRRPYDRDHNHYQDSRGVIESRYDQTLAQPS
jgi:dCTP deaminase